MRVHVCGVRGSTPAPGLEFVRYGGHTSCLAVAHDGAPPSLILDAGTGIRRVSALLAGAPFSGAILLTHLHWDHVQGLPFFGAGDRADAWVDVLLPRQPDGADAMEVLARGMSPPHFPIHPGQLRGAWSFGSVDPGPIEIGGFVIDARQVPHKGGRTFGYRVSDGRTSIAYLPDHCPTALGCGPDGWGAYHDDATALARNTEMLIHDAHLLPTELEAEASFGHAAADYAVGLAKAAGSRRVMLFHHRPDRTDEALDDLGRRFARAPLPVTVAAEGAVWEL